MTLLVGRFHCRHIHITVVDAWFINTLKLIGNYVYHLIQQSLTVHFVCMGLV
jgi:hypothetical protein